MSSNGDTFGAVMATCCLVREAVWFVEVAGRVAVCSLGRPTDPDCKGSDGMRSDKFGVLRDMAVSVVKIFVVRRDSSSGVLSISCTVNTYFGIGGGTSAFPIDSGDFSSNIVVGVRTGGLRKLRYGMP